MKQHFMHEILIGSSQYFTSYCIESRHLCEILKSGHLGWTLPTAGSTAEDAFKRRDASRSRDTRNRRYASNGTTETICTPAASNCSRSRSSMDAINSRDASPHGFLRNFMKHKFKKTTTNFCIVCQVE
jgi:hypothetical protein